MFWQYSLRCILPSVLLRGAMLLQIFGTIQLSYVKVIELIKISRKNSIDNVAQQ